MNISVCMATYNGAQYVVHQLLSILKQLDPGDEVVIVDDSSTDNTIRLIQEIADPRVKLYHNSLNRRDVFSFGRAISLAKNEFIFLSDQDDEWLPGRLALMRRELESGVNVVSSNFEWMDENNNSIHIPYDGVLASDSRKYLKNILDIFRGKTNYFGCAMAFRRSFAAIICPIPPFVESHDLWIALASNLVRSNSHLDEKTLRKRKHATNATSTVSTRSLIKKIRARIIFGISLGILFVRLCKSLFRSRI